jgi:hypothetical protein
MYRLALLVTTFLLAACQSDKPRKYTEIAPPSQGKISESMNASPVDVSVRWSMPQHWMQKDSASGMRAGSFAIPDSNLAHMGEMDPNAIDVSVTHFAGDAGGLEANIRRWMGQIDVRMDSAGMVDFIAKAERFQTATGESGLYIDLTELLSGDMTQPNSIFGAIVPGKGYTLFVKAMGQRKKVSHERSSIRDFCRSLELKEST